MFNLNYKKAVLSIFIYLFLIFILSSCRWYKCKATGKLIYNPLYTEQDLSNWNISEETFMLGDKVSVDKIEKMAKWIKSPASKEYFIRHMIYDLKTDISNQNIYQKFIINTEIVLNKETNVITITIPYKQNKQNEDRVTEKLVDNLMLLIINSSINLHQDKLIDSDREQERIIEKDFEVVKSAKSSCSIF